MSQAAQPTAAQHANPQKRLSDFNEDTVPEFSAQNLGQLPRLALEQGVGSPTTRGRDQDIESGTLPVVAGPEQDDNALSRIVDFPRSPHLRPSATLHALQEWEGYVTEINDTEFTANLTDLTAKATYAGEEAIIPIDEISEDDAAKMQVGSIFHWVIGYERRAGTKKRVSYIVFRDLPAITKADLQRGEEWAREIMAAFKQ